MDDTDTLNDREPVMVTETEREKVGEAVFDGEPELLRVTLTDAVSEPPGPREGDLNALSVRVKDPERDGLPDGDGCPDTVRETVPVRETDPDPVPDEYSVIVPLKVAETLGDCVFDIDAVEDALRHADDVRDGDRVSEGDLDCVTDAV